jgi:hypothetical protein
MQKQKTKVNNNTNNKVRQKNITLQINNQDNQESNSTTRNNLKQHKIKSQIKNHETNDTQTKPRQQILNSQNHQNLPDKNQEPRIIISTFDVGPIPTNNSDIIVPLYAPTPKVKVTLNINDSHFETCALIDSGASVNVLSETFASTMNIKLIELEQPILVLLADGTPSSSGPAKYRSQPIQMIFDENNYLVSFLVTHVPKTDIILGAPWLSVHNDLNLARIFETSRNIIISSEKQTSTNQNENNSSTLLKFEPEPSNANLLNNKSETHCATPPTTKLDVISATTLITQPKLTLKFTSKTKPETTLVNELITAPESNLIETKQHEMKPAIILINKPEMNPETIMNIEPETTPQLDKTINQNAKATTTNAQPEIPIEYTDL